MLAGALEFTLGIEANKFLSGISGAGKGMLALVGIADSLQAAFGQVWNQIERGGALQDLSARTGVAVRDLFQLQEAFQICGVGADAVAPMILRVQKSLSGLGEGGEKTKDLFAALGLNIKQLSAMDAPKQFQALAGAFQNLGKEDAIAAASKIFGREGAGNFLQVARSMGDFSQSLKDSASAADIFARSAANFDKLGDTLQTIRMKTAGMFAGIAEGFQPALQQIFDMLNKIDFVSIGKKIGNVFTGIFESFQDGTITDLITLSLEAAFEQAANFGNRAFQGMAAAMKASFEFMTHSLQEQFSILGDSLGTLFGASIKTSIAEAFGSVSDILTKTGHPLLAKGFASAASGLSASAADSITANEQSTKARTQELFAEWLGAIKQSGIEFSKAFSGAGNVMGTAKWEELQKKIAEFSARLNSGGAGSGGAGSGFDLSGLLNKVGSSGQASEVTSLEKMGLIIGGLGRGFGHDYARNTADATRQTAENTKAILSKLGIPKEPNFRNA